MVALTSSSLSAANGVSFASSSEIDAKVHLNVDYMLRLSNRELRAAYNIFTANNQTLSSLVAMNIAISVYTIPTLYVSCLNIGMTNAMKNDWGNWIALMCFVPVINIIIWGVYLKFFLLTRKSKGVLSPSARQFLRYFQMAVFFVVHSAVIAKFVIISGYHCHDGVGNILDNFNCNLQRDVRGIPMEEGFLVTLTPLLYVTIVRGANFEYSILLWTMALACFLFVMIYYKLFNSALLIIYYCVGSLIVIVEARKMNYFLFFSHQKLDEILIERQKAADEANAMEMRHMIANVAHDLKTPLTSFLGGVEFISHVLTDMKEVKTLRKVFTSSEIDDFVQSISHCVTNMRNTNSFMLMTINRCIDYTKASKGVKLVPKFETMDLMETLSLPLNCMKDIQQRVSIVLEAVSKEICSHIITDKQWLQENVLCLLSNAVKYSNEGEVRVRVERGDSGTDDYNSPQTHLSSRHLSHGAFSSSTFAKNADKNMHGVESSFLRVEVEDHGIGLSEDAMANLFSPFKQAQRLAGGTGLGLFSLAKRIEALDGKCGVERRRDGLEGSLFWFMIPYRADEQAAELSQSRDSLSSSHSLELPIVSPQSEPKCNDHPSEGASSKQKDKLIEHMPSLETMPVSNGQQMPASPSQKSNLGSSGLDILLVDDSPAILKMTSMMLKRHKHRVSTAVNGAEAVKMVIERVDREGRGFDVILMDLQMPVMDGLEATRRLREIEKKWNLVSVNNMTKSTTSATLDNDSWNYSRNIIIGVSANSDAETSASAYKVGVDAFIGKPFSLETFNHSYEMVIAQRKEAVGISRRASSQSLLPGSY